MSANTIPIHKQTRGLSERLNVGCGKHYHEDWVNLDLQSNDPKVLCHDVNQGIPFSEDKFEAVYHSHILEHLSPQQGRELIYECFRVLKPGGTLRVVVPDLEEIAQLYLTMHEQAWKGDERASVNYHWMKMELLDQMVRHQSGGLMGPYMVSISEDKAEFVQSRIGSEFQLCRAPDSATPENVKAATKTSRWRERWEQIKSTWARRMIRILMGEKALEAFEVSLFRSQGEIHRWMYDRFSMRELCENAGFVNFRVQSAFESQIEGYVDFQLDSIGNQIRKPDSLFIECQKPSLSMKASA